MTDLDPNEATIALASTARIMEDSNGLFRIRTGIWNFEEAVIDVSGESPAVAATVSALLRALATGPTQLEEHADAALLPIEKANLSKLVLDLAEAGVLISTDQRDTQDAITAALLGRLTSPYPTEEGIEQREIVFISDCEASRTQAAQQAETLGITLTSLPEEQLEALHTADLTSRINGYDTEIGIERLRETVAGKAAIVTCFQRPSIPMLRNLNRVVEDQDLPWVSSFIDGPFVSIVGIKSPHTGCFECFEQRALARLEDHVTYHEFAKSPVGRTSAQDSDAPMMGFVTVLALTEGYLYAAVGASRIAGRMLGIHLPTMEIQTQDLLRMPNCPACGRVSRQRLREINFNSRAVVDRVVSEVLQ
ncbi:TOMM precursor leader peptide-binding protein [Natronoglycomyces albus]|uniref:TOMM leader peptide-binding protein n=1 Tax=Natronoglycomyces albus TaxID=2811108 RepID=A0A895XTQ4_9ACTN|nr:TOMM precursor leader peptide-binding protein [Natronoglycomyces albus]QSB06863.1 TOMM precursor leader peptide-binding protein [Natronoglycomyces albus]